MAKKSGVLKLIELAFTECRDRNYHTEKNKRNDTGRLELNKFCPRCRVHRLHREVR